MQASKNGYYYVLDRSHRPAAVGQQLYLRELGQRHRSEDRAADRRAAGRLPEGRQAAVSGQCRRAQLAADVLRPADPADLHPDAGMADGVFRFRQAARRRDRGLLYGAGVSAGGLRSRRPWPACMDRCRRWRSSIRVSARQKPRLSARLGSDPSAARLGSPSLSNWDGGVLSTGGGLVFQGDGAGYLNVYAADSGKQLAHLLLGTGVMAAPMTYRIAGYPVRGGDGRLRRQCRGLPAARQLRRLHPRQRRPDHRTQARWRRRAAAAAAGRPVFPTPPPHEGTPAQIAAGEVLYNRSARAATNWVAACCLTCAPRCRHPPGVL
jgi:hypothetical protein